MKKKEKEQIFKELQAEIKAGIEAYERGRVYPSRRGQRASSRLRLKIRFDKLQEEINQSVLEMEQGIYFTAEDLVKRYGLSQSVE